MNLASAIDQLAFHFLPHSTDRFSCAVRALCGRIRTQLHLNESIFKDCLDILWRSAAGLDNELHLDLPLDFEIFLPMCLPMKVTATFNKRRRTVRLFKKNFQHPFFFGNAVNAKCMNLLLQRELKRIVAQIEAVVTAEGLVYELHYSALAFSNVPFVHQIVALESSMTHTIRFDFVLALEFHGAELRLPKYYKQHPLGIFRWYAYGLPTLGPSHDASEWAVIVPKWLHASAANCNRMVNVLHLLYRLHGAQGSKCFANALSLKFAFTLAVQDHEEVYERPAADLLFALLGRQVFHNFCQIIVQTSTSLDDGNLRKTLELRKQQELSKILLTVLAKGLRMDAVPMDLIYGLFQLQLPVDNCETGAVAQKRRHSV